MQNEWQPWDAAEYIETTEDVVEFLNAVLELGDPALLPEALGAVARSKGMSAIAKEAGVGRESLYKSLTRKGNPRFSTIAKVLDVMGLELQVALKHA